MEHYTIEGGSITRGQSAWSHRDPSARQCTAGGTLGGAAIVLHQSLGLVRPNWAAAENSSMTLASQGLIDSLASRYLFKNPLRVSAFIREHPYLVALLIRLDCEIRAVFGQGAVIALEVFADPEALSPSETLFALIQTKLTPVSAFALLSELDEKYWLDAQPAGQGKLTVDVEYL